jgi:hypothetical protein
MKLTGCHREAPRTFAGAGLDAVAILSSRSREGRDGFAALAMTDGVSWRGPMVEFGLRRPAEHETEARRELIPHCRN